MNSGSSPGVPLENVQVGPADAGRHQLQDHLASSRLALGNRGPGRSRTDRGLDYSSQEIGASVGPLRAKDQTLIMR